MLYYILYHILYLTEEHTHLIVEHLDGNNILERLRPNLPSIITTNTHKLNNKQQTSTQSKHELNITHT